MTLFDAVDHVVKVRNQAYSEIWKLPYYEFQFLLEKINKEAEEQQKQDEQDRKEADKYKSKTQFKPVDVNKMMRDNQSQMKNFNTKI